MAVTTFATNTQAATVTTEHELVDADAAGTYVLVVDTVNMVAGDVLELRIYQMVLTGGTARGAYYVMYSGAQHADDLIKVSVPVSTALAEANALRFTLKQTFGTSRNFPWTVLKHA